jgi:hypothetical protein
MNKKRAKTFRMDVSWKLATGDIDPELEVGLEKIVKKNWGGKESGSGTDFNRRDIGYYGFKSLKGAEGAAKVVKAMLEACGRKSVKTSCAEDDLG